MKNLILKLIIYSIILTMVILSILVLKKDSISIIVPLFFIGASYDLYKSYENLEIN
jgi:hypothetical protein